MASGQVSSKSTKSQEHLEAGRRRLEEFRKKKGAKKSAAASQPRTSNSTAIENQAAEHGPASDDSVSAANGITAVAADSDLPGSNERKHGFTHDSGSDSMPQSQNNFQSGNVDSPDLLQGIPNRVESETDIGDGKHEVATSLGRRDSMQDGTTSEFRSTFYDGHSNVTASTILPNSNVSTQNVAVKVLPEGHFRNLFHQHGDLESAYPINDLQASNSEFGHNQHGSTFKDYLSSNVHEKRPSDAVSSLLEFGNQRPPEPLSTSMNFNTTSLVSGTGILSSAVAETYSKRSRPSFLDSLNISRDSPASAQPLTEKEKSATSMFPNSSLATSSWDQGSAMSTAVEPLPNPVYPNANNNFGNGFMGSNRVENSLGGMLELRSQRQNEDFSALEQHIEDLTQEKFSLQRAMEASNALAVSLAAENSSLTESYNQQASVASQLRAEMESLQEEIKARLVELEAIRAEFTNAHLECNAADERAKLLASEVINMEEKALRLRSNELKLERELENSNAEIASYKKKVSSLDKERRDLQQSLNALQEENKLLQSKLRKASVSGIAVDLNRGHAKKDASTSTNDLSNSSEQVSSSIQRHYETDNPLSLLESSRSFDMEDVAMVIPPDQVQVIQNINSLMSELISEKEEAMRALLDEVSTSAKLKDMNKDLSHKLEVQTQRLELLTAQSMASDNPPVRQLLDSRIVQQSVTYADEGDEVVERVLGWIMKLFPGGPSKRRTSRL